MDRMQATPRGALFGLLSDLASGTVGYMQDPRRTQQMQGLAAMLESTRIPSLLEGLSYGDSMTTGSGMTMRPNEDVRGLIELATAFAPAGKPAAAAAKAGTMALGRAGERVGMAAEKALEAPLQRAYDKGGLSREMLLAMSQGTQSPVIRRVGEMGFDPRFDPRVKEQGKLAKLVTDVDEPQVQVPAVSLVDYEGRPFITSMADRTGVGLLKSIDDVTLNRPVNMQGGNDFMFNNPGMAWASGKMPSRQLLQEAEIIKQVTGQNPLYIPWRMAPSGGDFATMTGESMLSFAEANMNKGTKKKLDSKIKKMIPDWAGVNDPRSIEQFRSAPDTVRKALKNMMDTEFRDAGGLSIGQARLAVADPKQLKGAEGGLMNVGEIFADQPLITQSGHASYPYGVPGQGLGRLTEDVNIFQLMPNVVQARGIPDPMSPRQTDLRALQMKPYAGVITEGLLKQLGY
jgi:hypothetical protein